MGLFDIVLKTRSEKSEKTSALMLIGEDLLMATSSAPVTTIWKFLFVAELV